MTVKCSKGHVRHATASEQLPLGPMLDALRAPPVPPGRDMQASEDLFMDLDEQPSKRPRDTPSSSTQHFDFANPDEFVQRARNVSVPLPRTPEQPVPAPETPFQPWKPCRFLHATISMFSRRRDSARDAACGKLENCSTCAIILSSCLTFHAQHVCSSIHVARGSCCPD